MRCNALYHFVKLGLTVVIFAILVVWSNVRAADDFVRATRKIEPFELNQVRLLPSPFKDAQDKDASYLMSVEPDKLLAKFRVFAGLEPRAEHYDGWESQTIAGHSLGHYLAAVSSAYSSIGDVRFKEISDYIVDELAECQDESGLLAATPEFRTAFEEISRGNIRSQGFDLNGLWVPWYVLHKIENGLLEAYKNCDNPKALDVAKKLGDWGIDILKNLDDEQLQTMFRCEFGGMNDAYYDLYAATGDEKYLRAGDRFYHRAVFEPLAEGRDVLAGLHANTQIPKIVGLARRFELAGDGLKARETSEFFWERVVGFHTYSLGGNSNGEHFGAPGMLSERLSDSSAETCNTRNMLLLTKELYEQTGDLKYLSYFERALFNHLLAAVDVSDDPDKLFTYYIPLTRGGFRTYSNRFHNWTCCHGTGMENCVRYNGVIYWHEKTDDGGDVLLVNLAIPSTLDWNDKGVRATITPDFLLNIAVKDKTKLVVKVRVPNNCRVVDPNAVVEDGYLVGGENWEPGETSVRLPFVPDWKLESTPDNPNSVSFFRGPFLYAGDVGPIEKPIASAFDDLKKDETISIPVVVSNSRNLNDLIDVANNEQKNSFALPPTAKLIAAKPGAVDLVPFFKATRRYNVYFDFFDENAWNAEQEKFVSEREREAKLAAATVDTFQPGEMQPERDAKFVGEQTNFGEFNGRKWRDARDGGYFEFSLKVDPKKTCVLLITYWGDDGGNRVFDVLIDGKKVATKRLDSEAPGRFFDETYPIENVNGAEKIRIRFQGAPGAIAGGIFFARTLRLDNENAL